MQVREAVEEDAPRLGELADGPTDVMRNLVHDRTVRVAIEERVAERSEATERTSGDAASSDAEGDEAMEATSGDATSSDDSDGGEDEVEDDVVGFVSFDAREGVVHVTQLAGPPDVCERLIEEPVGFAERERMAVELLVPAGEENVRQAAEAAEFTESGKGPRFAGTETTRYRREVETATR